MIWFLQMIAAELGTAVSLPISSVYRRRSSKGRPLKYVRRLVISMLNSPIYEHVPSSWATLIHIWMLVQYHLVNVDL